MTYIKSEEPYSQLSLIMVITIMVRIIASIYIALNYVPGTMISALQIPHFTTTLGDRCFSYPHFQLRKLRKAEVK